jgi:predicted RNA-binding Zn ribbon-like protein
MPKAHSHMHKESRSYLGEKVAKPLIHWLNSPAKNKSDVVERLLQANADFATMLTGPAAMLRAKPKDQQPSVALRRDFTEAFRRSLAAPGILHALLKKSRLTLTPELATSSGDYWTVDWRPRIGRHKNPAQAEALYRALQLASRGLLSRVRKCERPGCGVWFFARFTHARFHNARCQQQVFRSDPDWKRKRREYMKELRQLHKGLDKNKGGQEK